MKPSPPSATGEPLAAHPVQLMVDPTTGAVFYIDEGTGERLAAEGVAAGPAPAAARP